MRSGPTQPSRLPAALGFRMPAEWEPHEATWIAWPHRGADWPGKFATISWVYGEIVRHLHRSERVRILIADAALEGRARRVLSRLDLDWSRLELFRWPTNRVWMRDYGPAFVTSRDGRAGIVGWCFNGWAKYRNWQRDATIPARVAGRLNLPFWKPAIAGRGIVLEGGSIDVNGQGLLLTTKECLLSPIQARNPGLDRLGLEQVLADHLNVSKILWLGSGIAGDDTHGHVDDIARFVGPTTIVAAVEDNPTDMNYEPLRENLERLHALTDLQGRRLEVVRLPMPRPVIFDGRRLPASYANFYIANDRVLVPTFNDSQDRVALGTLAELFPGRQVIGIHAVDLVWGLGTLHCLTLQQPAAKSKAAR